MAGRTIIVPDFDFTAFYYPQILEAAIKWMRANVPEITNENPGEPAIQMLRAQALVGHLNNVLLDLTAHEALMVTAQLRDSVVGHLKLIAFEVPGDIPSNVEVVLRLSKTFIATEQVVPDNALFATKRTSTSEPIVFETDNAVSVSRTDELSQVWVYDESTDTYTDVTAATNSTSTPVTALPATPAVGDVFYIGHDSAMTNRLKIIDITQAMNDVYGVWEYGDDGVNDELPDLVTNLGATLKLIIDSMLDTDGSIVYTGLEVGVIFDPTGASETLISQHDGTNNYVETTGFLGQTTPSTAPTDYSIGALWHRVDGVDDGTNDGNTTLEIDGNIDFTLPKTTVDNWQPTEVNAVTAFWLRFRVTSIGATPVPPILDVIQWNKRDTYVQVTCTQGRTRTETIGSSSGEPSQTFVLGATPVIPETINIVVDSSTWTEVDNFLNSTGVDEHYTTAVDSDGVATVVFGDGINGKVPPSGTNNIVATYRTDADLDGNVGSNTILVNRAGVSNIKSVFNPRPATGWEERRGNNDIDREKLKVEGPASLRTLERAVGAPDIEFLSTQFQAEDLTRPFERAKAFEGALGPKSTKIVVVGAGGASVPFSKREELEKYFNGDPLTGASGVLVANQAVFVRNYVPVTVPITAVITGGSLATIESALQGLIGPTALESDGITYRWDLGDTITRNKIIATIFQADPDVEDVSLTIPAANVVLNPDELPVLGTLTLTSA